MLVQFLLSMFGFLTITIFCIIIISFIGKLIFKIRMSSKFNHKDNIHTKKPKK